ncbi:BRO-N domain-containing protein, partial [Escherichia coli]
MTANVTPSVFHFESEATIRAIVIDGNPWFVAKDVIKALQLTNPTMSIKSLDDDERAKFNLGRQGETNIINESGLYTLILRCRDAVTPGTIPYRFRKWVTGEVLPQIRRTGSYIKNSLPQEERIKMV